MSALPFIAFVLLASPMSFRATRGIFGNWIANAEGLATFPGLLLHALVFVLVVGFLMRRFSRYNQECVSGNCYVFKTQDDADDSSNERYQRDRFVFTDSV